MLRKIAMLLAPGAAATGGGGAAAADPMLESDPSAMDGWMNAIGDLAGSPAATTPAQLKKDTDGTPPANGTGNPATAGATAAADANKGASNVSADTANPGAAAAKAKADADAAAAKAAEEAAAKKGAEGDEEKWPRNQGDWTRFKEKRAEKEAKLNAEIKARDEKIAAFEDRIKQMESAGVQAPAEFQKKIDQLEKERNELSERLQMTDVTNHPKFQRYFKDKVDEQYAVAAEILGVEKSDAFKKIIELPNGEFKKAQLEEFVGDLSVLDQARIGAVLNQFGAIGRERESAIKAEAEKLKAAGDRSSAEMKARVEKRDKLFTDLSTAVTGKDGHVAYQLKENDPAWNKSVQERIAVAKNLLTGQGISPEQVIRACFDAAAMPAVLEAYKADKAEMQGKISSLEAQIAKMSAVQPGVEKGAAGDAGQQGGGKTALKVGMNPTEAMGAFVSGLME